MADAHPRRSRNRGFLAATAWAALAATATLPATAHSIDELEALLGSREKFFQALDVPAADFDLRDVSGAPVTPDALRGQVVVLFFIYTHCPDVCPLHAARIAVVQDMVNRTPMREAVRFVAVTTDPSRDTAEVLSDYGADHGFDPANWAFLTIRPGDAEDTTRRLAERYGHRFDRSANGAYQTHGIVTHVIDKYGRWRANFHGLRFDPTNMVVFLNALVNDTHTDSHAEGPAGMGIWDRVRSFF